MAKKRRTELDIDPDIGAPEEADANAPPAEEAPSSQEEKLGNEAPQSKRNYVKLSIITGLAVVIISLIGVIGYSLLSDNPEEPEKKEIKEEKPAPIKKPPPPKPVKRHVEFPELYQFSPFLVRVGKAEKQTLIRIDFAVEMSSAKVRKEIERNLVLIRENIYLLLSSEPLQAFKEVEKRRKMAIDVAIILNRSIQSGAVTKTLITRLTVF